MLRSQRIPLVPLSLVLLALAAGCGSDRDSNPTSPPPTRELNSPLIAQNATYQHTFASAGVYPYHCTPHPTMRDTIYVEAGGAASASLSIQGLKFPAPRTAIQPGGFVIWTNLDAQGHTVTSD